MDPPGTGMPVCKFCKDDASRRVAVTGVTVTKELAHLSGVSRARAICTGALILMLWPTLRPSLWLPGCISQSEQRAMDRALAEREESLRDLVEFAPKRETAADRALRDSKAERAKPQSERDRDRSR